LPVVHYRALKNNVGAPSYWEKGNKDNVFRDDNYTSRYHDRHTDLKDVLSSYNESAGANLNDIAVMLGFPGTLEMNTAQVWKEYLQGNIKTIRNHGETGVLNNYLVYLRFQLIRGEINEEELKQELTLLREKLDQSGQAHLQEFSGAWEH